MNTQKYFKNGFTLAEVLITLVIIGIIAAMTVPTLINNTNKQEFVTGVKKANSTLSQALIEMARNNDSSPGDYTFLNNTDFIEEFAKVANVLKKCNNTSQCFGSDLNGGGVYKKLNQVNTQVADGKSVITADGQLYTYSVSPGHVYGITADDEANFIGRIVVDVNGSKSPNVYGRDVFFFYVVNGKGIVPAGSAGYADCVETGAGASCAGRVLKENAMNY